MLRLFWVFVGIFVCFWYLGFVNLLECGMYNICEFVVRGVVREDCFRIWKIVLTDSGECFIRVYDITFLGNFICFDFVIF